MEKSLDGEQCHNNAVFDVEWMPNEMKIISVSGDHTAKLWDLTESKLVETRVFHGHSRSVKTAAFRQADSSVFATGGRDGSIRIWDTRATLNIDLMPRADNCIYSGHAGGPGTPLSHRKKTRFTPKLPANASSSSITGLVFQDDNTLISCGAGDGLIKVWDMRRNYTAFKKEPTPKHSLPYAGTSTYKGFTNLLIDNTGYRLYASCMDSNIYCYNISTYSGPLLQKYVGAKIGSFYIKTCLSPDGKYILSGSTDEKAYIWNVEHENPLLTLNGHAVEVTCVAWSHTKDISLVTCSDDARHKIWRIPVEEMTKYNRINYPGIAEACPDYSKTKNCLKRKAKMECTPRSIKRLVELNEKTPTTIEKNFYGKRSYSMLCDENDVLPPEPKRLSLESKGRRLFSPPASTSRAAGGIQSLDITKGMHIIFEEAEPTPTSPKFNKTSPLSERLSTNLIHLSPSSSQPFSPTSNLPNFVLDGEAPHLRVQSPKRKLKENVDWLTKIRKQKILSLNNDKQSNQYQAQIDISRPETPTRSIGTKRRLSGFQDTPERHPKTPRRNSTAETTILRFFNITPSSTTHHHHSTATTAGGHT